MLETHATCLAASTVKTLNTSSVGRLLCTIVMICGVRTTPTMASTRTGRYRMKSMLIRLVQPS